MSFITKGIGDIVGSLTGANQQAQAASTAAGDQEAAAQAGINLQQNEFNTVRGLLSPYVNAGTNALGGYNTAMSGYQGILGQLNNLTGANGNGAQQQAITGLQSNPLYTSSMQLGQQAILANASATGGLRGGNTIANLGYLPNQVLSNVMQQRIGNLGTSLNGQGNVVGQYGNLVNLGENAAAGTGNAAMSTGNNITNLTGQIGAAQGGAAIAGGNATASGLNALGSILGGNTLSGIGSSLSSLWNSAAGLLGGGGSGGTAIGLASLA